MRGGPGGDPVGSGHRHGAVRVVGLLHESGLTGQRSHPDVVKAERKTIETALKMGKHPRVELADISGAKPYLEMGVKHFCIGWDVRILYNWWRTNGTGMRAMLTGEAAVAPAPQPVKTGTY